MKTRMKSLRMLLTASLAVAASFATGAPSPARGYRVTLLVYSGRPNPTFTVTDPKQVTQLEAHLTSSVSSGRSASPSHPILGYNGVMLEPLAGEARIVAKGRSVELAGTISLPAPNERGARGERQAVGGALDAPQWFEADGDALETLALTLARERGVLDASAQSMIDRTR